MLRFTALVIALLLPFSSSASTKALAKAARCALSVRGNEAVLELGKSLEQIRIVGKHPAMIVYGNSLYQPRRSAWGPIGPAHLDEYVLHDVPLGKTQASRSGFGESQVERLFGGDERSYLTDNTCVNLIALSREGRITPTGLSRAVNRHVQSPMQVTWRAVTTQGLRTLLQKSSFFGAPYTDTAIERMVESARKFRGNGGQILIGEGAPDGVGTAYVAVQQERTRNLAVLEVRTKYNIEADQ